MAIATQRVELEPEIIKSDLTRFEIPRRGEILPSRPMTSPSGIPRARIVIFEDTNYVPGRIVFKESVLDITRNEILQAIESDFINKLFSTNDTPKDVEQIRQQLASWIEEKLQESKLNLTEDAKVTLTNIIALIMKKVNQKLRELEG